MFVSKSPPWNALEVVRINHKSYFQQLVSSGTPRQSLQMHFEFELQSLKMCLDPIDLVYQIKAIGLKFEGWGAIDICNVSYICIDMWIMGYVDKCRKFKLAFCLIGKILPNLYLK